MTNAEIRASKEEFVAFVTGSAHRRGVVIHEYPDMICAKLLTGCQPFAVYYIPYTGDYTTASHMTMNQVVRLCLSHLSDYLRDGKCTHYVVDPFERICSEGDKT